MYTLKTGEQARRRTVTRTLRIDEEWDGVLREEADKQGVTVSAIMSQVLRRYVSSGRFFERYQNIVIGKTTLNAILDKASTRDLSAVGKAEGATRPREQLLEVGLPQSLESVSWLIEELYGRNNHWFQCEHHVIKDQTVFTLIHDMGKGWSVFVSSYSSSMFRSLLGLEVATRVEDDYVTIYVDNKLV
jgi:hypothetical protein